MAKKWCEFCKKYEHLKTPEILCLKCTIDVLSMTDENQYMYEMFQTISLDHSALKGNKGILIHQYEVGKYCVYHFKGYPKFL